MIDDLDDVIRGALDAGNSVELVPAEEYGYQIAIDGTPLFGHGDGIPHEAFGWPLDDIYITDEAAEIVDGALRRKRRNLRVEMESRVDTERHAAAEGKYDD